MKNEEILFWVCCWPFSYLGWSWQGEMKWPQCLYTQAIKFYVKLNPGHLRASVDQVLIRIFPRPQKLSAMDEEISSGIIHSAPVLCTTKAATTSLQLPISLAPWRMAWLLRACLHCQLQADACRALNWSYLSLGAVQRCKCRIAAMLMSPAEWHCVLPGFRHMHFFQGEQWCSDQHPS